MPRNKNEDSEKANQHLLDELEALRLEVDSLRSKAEESNRTERLLREALDTFPDHIVLFDKDERVVFSNDRYHAEASSATNSSMA